MSRTDKQSPWRVKAFFRPDWIEEHHDHTKGVCTLPEKPTVENVDQPHGGNWGTCYWTYSLRFIRDSMQRCSCEMCGYDAYDTPRRFRQRREGRRYVRGGWTKEY